MNKLEHWVIELTVKRFIKKEIKKMLEQLKGKRTYVIAAAFAILAFLEHAGFLSRELAQEIVVFLNGAGFAALRAAKK